MKKNNIETSHTDVSTANFKIIFKNKINKCTREINTSEAL